MKNPAKSKTILITGGARSGKSTFAQELAQESPPPVLFVATAEARDEEMRLRIKKHQKDRPTGWQTLEAPQDTGEQIRRNASTARTIIVDCITLLVSNVLQQYSDAAGEQVDESAAEKAVNAEIGGLLTAIQAVPATFILVTNEVGLGLVPSNKLGRVYRDLLGKVNQKLAQHANEVYLMVSGIPVPVKADR
ncbi:MAG: bifunctional adenosylcobinamide kinase/adenosylcobinamide-phosphate guanylyltransferase [Dehalococcoidales bacterium]|nr:bifunctional adenosylcobinamide kinase/adenosylcobinamide-phosphate guanylyltransferase [Dehalococcoidales bacterium]